MLDLDAYLERIGFDGTPRTDLDTLTTLHRLHLRAIPYENLDVQLGVPVSLDIEPVFDKLVHRRRGGWCYEMNGLFAWALEAVGFSITRLAAGVMRVSRGEGAVGNHLAIRVQLDEPYLADVGFGDGALEPVALRPGPIRQGHLAFALERLPGGWWRFHNQPHGAAASFDFADTPADPEVLARQCEFLQTSPESPFTQVAVVQRHVPEGLALMRGRVLTRVGVDGVVRHEVADAGEYRALLRDTFALELDDFSTLWCRVEAQHAAYLERRLANLRNSERSG